MFDYYLWAGEVPPMLYYFTNGTEFLIDNALIIDTRFLSANVLSPNFTISLFKKKSGVDLKVVYW